MKWREELHLFGKSLGILTEEEAKELEEKKKQDEGINKNVEEEKQKEKEKTMSEADKLLAAKIEELTKYEEKLLQSNMLLNMYLQNGLRPGLKMPDTPKTRQTSPDQKVKTPKTGRFNETKSNAAYSRKCSRRSTRGGTKDGKETDRKIILCREEAEREMWLLQILCQILRTESMQEIQSWLCSANQSGKKLVFYRFHSLFLNFSKFYSNQHFVREGSNEGADYQSNGRLERGGSNRREPLS